MLNVQINLNPGEKDQKRQRLTRGDMVATGIGYKVTSGKRTSSLSIVCSVTKKVAVDRILSKDRVPEILDGIPADVVQTGRIRALQTRTSRIRPVPGGVSIGHRDITTGTLGCLVKKMWQIFILSNNHVLANSNAAEVGDPPLQPGPYDGDRFPENHIANLEQFVPISFTDSSSNYPIAIGTTSFLNKTRVETVW